MKLVMRNVFLEKSYTKSGRETRPRLFKKKKKKLCISPDQQFGHLYSLFSLYAQDKDYQNILKLRY